MAKVHPDAAVSLPEAPARAAACHAQPGVTEELAATVLTVWRKSLLFNCDGFTVFDASGDLAFRVDCYGSTSGGSRSRRRRCGLAEDVVLMGPAGAPLLTVRRKRLSLAEHWVIYDGDGGSDGDSDARPLLSVRRCHAGFRHAHAPSSSSKQKALAHVTPLASAPSVSGAEAYVVEGSYERRSVAVRDVARGGEAASVAEVRRKESPVGDEVFRLVVPDPSRLGAPLAMGIVIALDEMFGRPGASARSLLPRSWSL